MAKALLLACGNTLRGDDGVGWWIGGQVEQNLTLPELEVVLTHQLLPEFADPISKAEVVVFVDCSAVTAPGAVSVFPVEAAAELPRILTHQLDPSSLLRMAVDYYGRTPRAAIAVTVGGQSFGLADGLSDAVQAAVPSAVKAVEGILLELQLHPAD